MNNDDRRKEHEAYYFIDPDGVERTLGHYKTEASARQGMARQLMPDYRSLCSWPYAKRDDPDYPDGPTDEELQARFDAGQDEYGNA